MSAGRWSKASWALWVIAIGSVVSAAQAVPPVLPDVLIGNATTLEPGGKAVYKEIHRLVREQQRIVEVQTDYLDPAGKKVAEMRTDLRHDRYLPAYRYRDLRHGLENGVERLPDGMIRMFRVDPKRKQSDELRLKALEGMVAGQGVFFFLNDRATEIAARKEPLTVQFLVPSRLGSYPFRVRPREPSKAQLIPFRVEFKNWVFRLFAPFIEVDFDAKLGRLVEYRGASNVHDDRRQVQSVRISYQYDGHVIDRGP